MAQVSVDGLDLEYETRGSETGQPLVLVGGLGTQLISWPDSLVDGLVARGFRVVMFDNRDAGLSTAFDSAGPADLKAAFAAARAKQPVPAPYTLEDMADDVARLLDGLGIPAAHIVGSSNGGAIAQLVAIRHPKRVLSLVSVMATSGRRGLPRPTEAAGAWLGKQRKPELTREEFMEEAVDTARVIGSPGFPRDEAAIREKAGRLYDRSYRPLGHGRHLLASIASGDGRVEHLSSIGAPTLVVHGADDPLVPVGCGEDVTNTVRDARMLVIPGMGHDYPEPAVPQIVDAIAENAARAGRA